jgi:hypothetical protein
VVVQGGTNVVKNAGTTNNYDGMATSTTSFTNNGGFQCDTAASDTSRVILGLSTAADTTLSTIEYSIVIGDDTDTYYVRESNEYKTSTTTTFTKGATFQILVSGGTVMYYMNNTLVYTSTSLATGQSLHPVVLLVYIPSTCINPQLNTVP